MKRIAMLVVVIALVGCKDTTAPKKFTKIPPPDTSQTPARKDTLTADTIGGGMKRP